MKRSILGRRATSLLLAGAAGLAVIASATESSAQTWEGGRTTPSGLELVAVDATGEPFWAYGAEDLAGDGDRFEDAERAIDLRSAYAATDDQRFWARVYIADDAAPGPTIVAFVFIDSDANPASGGTAAATDVNPGLTTDPTGGGWDGVLVLHGDATPPDVWRWNDGPDRWEQEEPEQGEVVGENGRDDDPLGGLTDDTRGYLQGNVLHALVDLTPACGARIYVRSVRDTPEGGGDLDLGEESPCVPVDANADGVPDAAVPPSCDADDDCPFDGLCQDGRCLQTELCRTAAECDADEDCSADGRCVARPGGTCSDDTTCSSQLCDSGACASCTLGGNECGAGRRCGPDGRCVAGGDPGTGATGSGTGNGAGGGDGFGGDVQGGACTCDVVRGDAPIGAWLAPLVAGAIALARRARRGGTRGREVRS